jgi:ribosomal protein L29
MNAAIKITDTKKIRTEISALKKSILNFRFQKSTGQLEKTSEIRKTRKKIARLKTEISKIKGGANA